MTSTKSRGIRVSILYAPADGGRFDVDYYVEQHVPMAFGLLQAHGCRSMSVDRGVSGGRPGSPAPYAVVGHMEFDSVEAFQAAMGAVGAEIQADVPKYTDRRPLTQIAEIVDVRVADGATPV